MMTPSKEHVLALLENYGLLNNDSHLKKTKDFVSLHENLFGRDNLKGHITGSAWVINTSRTKALLIHHKKLDKWFQPGGHVDNTDLSILHAAKREAIEETGSEEITALSNNLFDLDVHLIPERKGTPAHWHYDFRFIFETQNESLNADFKEVNDTQWIPLNDLLQNDKFSSVKRMVKKTLHSFKENNNQLC